MAPGDGDGIYHDAPRVDLLDISQVEGIVSYAIIYGVGRAVGIEGVAEFAGTTPVTPLLTWQVNALRFLAESGPDRAAGLFAGLGVGKTRVILEDARAKNAALVVVCPKTAILVWEAQIARWNFTNPVLLVNYERVWRNAGSAGVNRDILAFIQRYKKSHHIMIVCDEAHKLKDRTSKQSKGCRRLGQYAAHRRVMTGTPVLNGLHDLWALFNFLIGDWPDMRLWSRWKTFAEDHVVYHPIFPGKVEAIRNPQTIQQQIAPFVFSVQTDDVIDLPESTDLVHPVEMPRDAQKVYRNLQTQMLAEFDEQTITSPTALVKLLRLAEVTGGFVHTEDGQVVQVHDAKLDVLRDVLEEAGDEKVVVFCRFTAERKAVQALLRNHNIPGVGIYGGQTTAERAAALEAFRKDARVLVASLGAGAESIDLTAARYAVFYSIGFSFGEYTQARARIRRLGQTRKTFYVHLVCPKTIDDYIAGTLACKGKVSDAVREWWHDHQP